MSDEQRVHVHRNHVQIAGLIGIAPLLRYTRGRAISTFTVHTLVDGEAEVHRCVAFDRLAERVQPLELGEHVEVTGKLHTYTRTDRLTREATSVVQIVCEEVTAL